MEACGRMKAARLDICTRNRSRKLSEQRARRQPLRSNDRQHRQGVRGAAVGPHRRRSPSRLNGGRQAISIRMSCTRAVLHPLLPHRPLGIEALDTDARSLYSGAMNRQGWRLPYPTPASASAMRRCRARSRRGWAPPWKSTAADDDGALGEGWSGIAPDPSS
jgi:hypothetical protein